jgi:hypothetical protein
MSVESESSGRPSTSTTNENAELIKDLVHDNRHITIRELANKLGLIWIMPEHFGTRSEDAMDCSEIRALSTE